MRNVVAVPISVRRLGSPLVARCATGSAIRHCGTQTSVMAEDRSEATTVGTGSSEGAQTLRSWQLIALVSGSYVCSSKRMALGGLPDWWTYPTCCANGHQWRPGRVIVSWMPCLCDAAREAQDKGPWHRVIACRSPDCGFEVYQPPHDPATAGLAQPCTDAAGSCSPRWRAAPPRSAKQPIQTRQPSGTAAIGSLLPR